MTGSNPPQAGDVVRVSVEIDVVARECVNCGRAFVPAIVKSGVLFRVSAAKTCRQRCKRAFLSDEAAFRTAKQKREDPEGFQMRMQNLTQAARDRMVANAKARRESS